MYIGNILQGISQFTTEKNVHVKRIHISHDDLDGVSCTALIKLSQAILNKDTDSPITYVNISNPSEIHDKIQDMAYSALEQGFSRDHDMLAFLITDIGAVDPKIFDKLNEDGIPTIYIVLDHHPQRYFVETASDYDLISTKDKEIFRNTGYYVIAKESCATYTLNDIMLRTLHAYRDIYQVSDHVVDGIHWNPNPVTNSSPLTNLEKGLSEFATMVDKWDTGKWGKWNGDPENTAIEIKLNLIFQYFKRKGEDFSDRLLSAMQDITDTTNWFKDWYEIARTECTKLQEYYKVFISKLHTIEGPISIPVEINGTTFHIDLGLRAKYYIETEEHDEVIDNFSLFSREYLETTDTNLLINVDMVHHTIGLRSQDKDVNCTRIAVANGGGGHPKAAGFPFQL